MFHDTQDEEYMSADEYDEFVGSPDPKKPSGVYDMED
jgi:hypothetical protein